MADLLKFTLLLTSLTIPIGAQDFGTYGNTYPIEEEDLIEYIKARIRSLDNQALDEIQSKLSKHYKGRFQRPKPIDWLGRAEKHKILYFDPTIITKEDIKDEKGKVVIPKGTSYNPLEHTSLSQDLLFFDGDQEEHIKWAKSFGDQTKWILINGKPLELEEQEKRPVFFDQYGILSKKLSIKAIPARISQEGKLLKIELIPLEELACAS